MPIIASPDARVPPAEKRKIYENKVPEINPWRSTFRAISIRVSLRFILARDKRIGRFANPRRMKGSGFGIIYSIADKNMQSAAKKEMRCMRGEKASFWFLIFMYAILSYCTGVYQ